MTAQYVMIANNFSAFIRPAAVAGMFYPGHEQELRNTVRHYMQSAGEESVLNIALDEMNQKAAAMGANAVVGIDIDYGTLGDKGSMLMVSVNGTAVKY